MYRRKRVTLPAPDKNLLREAENATVSQGWEDKQWCSQHLQQSQNPTEEESKEQSVSQSKSQLLNSAMHLPILKQHRLRKAK